MSVSVVCTGLTKTFNANMEALRPTNVTFEAGQTTALVGPSGCGKSTLLRLIADLETPSAGTVLIGGLPPKDIMGRAGLSVAFQDPSLLPWRSVRKNIELALRLARQPIVDAEIDQLIGMVGLEGFADTRPAELSGGMRQRAAIARSLSTKPDLLLLDEPFGAVDELTRRQLVQDLPRVWETQGATTILVTHSVSEAVMLSDRILVLSARPATIVADVKVDLPRPRSAQVTRQEHYSRLVETVFAALAKGMCDAQSMAAQ